MTVFLLLYFFRAHMARKPLLARSVWSSAACSPPFLGTDEITRLAVNEPAVLIFAMNYGGRGIV